MSSINCCSYCCSPIYHEEDQKVFPDDLPDDIHVCDAWDFMYYHRWCFENVVAEERGEIASKHAHG